ncbi:hypothetical protein CES85_1301 [Ochrobactrum quorumnocens]|uniref:Uncharacterized protein n=1 Tax=Ochrobactrum quorumnocens TaxID=271865 RepID=A0A248UKJ5_9HYPH|nr:hypothetical protein CES85_1301 [[Ochrobactrum] quorumnocens]
MCGIGALLTYRANKCKPCDHYTAKDCIKASPEKREPAFWRCGEQIIGASPTNLP